jgi:hypothetical protein
MHSDTKMIVASLILLGKSLESDKNLEKYLD